MTTIGEAARGAQAAVVITRTYRAPVEALWALWTTKAGFESWWGPDGFRVEVHAMEARLGGALDYDMIADAPEAIAAMREMGQPVSHGTRGRFSVFQPPERLALTHVIDFVPGSPVYEQTIEVDFRPDGPGQATMTVTIQPHLDPHWTQMSVEGFTSQLGKLDARFGWTPQG
ncbi:SRPBCC family protein [Caulobacter sp. KR2-114]|uniref:SRPBCC family protein n=1 Tax=Caulobacter sp. KR2-114 TaxID=3400912 RepID=UPI003C0A97A3